MKNLLGALVGLLLIGSVHANEVAVVDFRAALLQSDVGKQEAVEPKKQVAEMDARLKSEQEKLKTMANNLKRDELTLAPDELKKRRIELAQGQNKVRSMAAGMQRQAKQLEQQLIQKLTPKGEAALKEIIKERKLDLVLNRELIIYAKANADITKELIERMNKGK
ncbi:OmpH family outer membrane protein [Marinomonas pollencensis]|uniref:Periplasmic chaperone for outer membrane proteins Skp n=1 Tax=Marinomonas pollencensis TaxID=491954 RepID=A0A3E0DTK8_9GAMM|nr:OmpH family outer membrane protein [Marinomonas pollencensis]REG86882.1 periplasmic chaperone for outer membrane proteins Skp [Marinomonas pollencensis]